jgi:two-component system sensor histidine kinase ChvG
LLGERFKLARAEAEIAADALDGARCGTQALIVRIGRNSTCACACSMAGPAAGRQFRTCPAQLCPGRSRRRAWYQHARGCSIAGWISSSARRRWIVCRAGRSLGGQLARSARARAAGSTQVYLRYAPDRTPI